ncbi:hypothetical protein Cs7R123_58850 [Catellatospora sp. TT07R-123]|uniref:hypothetical protein n=1 Tax=Catellatospora sp. TT07R-123 TaxID=2733863 RepID=UPI001B042051|nr:hypothetical protein [Catellatospora sp. TT07R-123]GHJ48543.1 hypothetical protein Cs7R123_58850 [Catellatospora sp. TT07R-123]
MSNPVETVGPAARRALAVTFSLLIAVLAGCDSTLSAAPAASPPQQQVRASPPHPALFGIRSDTLGSIVIDVQGYVLYRFDGDSAAPSRALCVDECVAAWLPVPATDPVRVEGIDRQLIGSVLRPDGGYQLTLAGWPLYGYRGDRMPGDTFGHSLDGRWFAVTPVGTRAGPSPGTLGTPAG